MNCFNCIHLSSKSIQSKKDEISEVICKAGIEVDEMISFKEPDPLKRLTCEHFKKIRKNAKKT